MILRARFPYAEDEGVDESLGLEETRVTIRGAGGKLLLSAFMGSTG